MPRGRKAETATKIEPFGALRLIDIAEVPDQWIVPDIIPLSDGTITIGRSNKADVQLSAIKDGNFIISRIHATLNIDTAEGTVTIEDNGAVNGIFVNQVRIKAVNLVDGDVVQFGGMSETAFGEPLLVSDKNVRYRVNLTRKKKGKAASSNSADSRDPDAHSASSSNASMPVAAADDLPVTLTSSSSSKRSVAEDSSTPAAKRVRSDGNNGNNNSSLSELRSVAHSIAAPVPAPALSPPQLPPPIMNNNGSSSNNHVKALQDEMKQMRENQQVENDSLRGMLGTILTMLQTQQTVATTAAPPTVAASVQVQQIDAAVGTNHHELLPSSSSSSNSNPGNKLGGNKVQLEQSILHDMLTCLRCHQLLLSTVTLSCSHSICSPCLASLLAAKGGRSIIAACPTCNVPVDSKRMCRCDKLDELVWLLVEGDETQRQEFETRRNTAIPSIQRLAPLLDMTQNETAMEQEERQEQRDLLQEKAKVIRKRAKEVICDNCGESGHDEKACPHRGKEEDGNGSDNESDL